MRGPTPRKLQKRLKIRENSREIPKIIHIYLYFYGFALATPGRDLDATKRACDHPTPKKRTLGPASSRILRASCLISLMHIMFVCGPSVLFLIWFFA